MNRKRSLSCDLDISRRFVRCFPQHQRGASTPPLSEIKTQLSLFKSLMASRHRGLWAFHLPEPNQSSQQCQLTHYNRSSLRFVDVLIVFPVNKHHKSIPDRLCSHSAVNISYGSSQLYEKENRKKCGFWWAPFLVVQALKFLLCLCGWIIYRKKLRSRRSWSVWRECATFTFGSWRE